MNIECIRPPSHSSNSWSRSWLDEGVEECEPWRETGWKLWCNPAPGCRHKLPKFDKISFTQNIQLTLVHSPQRQILDPLQLSAWAGPSWVTDFRAVREQGWSSFLVSPSWKIFCKTLFHSMSDVTWCHTNLSQFPVRLRDTRYSLSWAQAAASDPGPGTDVWLKCLPRSAQAQRSGASWKSQAETRVTHSLWLRWVIAGIMTLLRLPCGYPWQWQHSRDSGDSLTLCLLRLADFCRAKNSFRAKTLKCDIWRYDLTIELAVFCLNGITSEYCTEAKWHESLKYM